MPLPVLLTRPRADADALAARVATWGGRPVITPLLEIAATGPLPALSGGVILTSPNAVSAYRALGGAPGRPAWCVGPRTAAAARAAGLDVRGVAPTADALARAIPDDAPPLTHLHGRHVRGDLPAALRARGLVADGAVIYEQRALALTPEAVDTLAAGPVLAPLYSPRSARLLAAGAPEGALAQVHAVCISRTVAAVAPFGRISLADAPDGAAMERALHAALAAIGG